MTRTPLILGAGYDAPAALPDGLDLYEPKRQLALTELRRAETANQSDVAQLMSWELGLIDLVLAPADGVSPYRGGDYEQFAQFYKLTEEAARHARERAGETQDVILRLHYLEYVLLRMEPRGRAWVDLQRELLVAYRAYVDGCLQGISSDSDRFAGLHVERAVTAVGRLLRRPGVVRGGESADWAAWLLSLAEASRAFPPQSDAEAKQMRHRWVASYLEHLEDLRPDAADAALRAKALELLGEAGEYYRSTPLNDHFEHHVAEREASLRKHWGETDTHPQLIRRKYDALVRRAEFHRGTGNGLLTAHFFREARRLVEGERQYFTNADVSRLQVAEQTALDRAVDAGEFHEIRVPIAVPREMMDYTRGTVDETMQALLAQVVGSVPNRSQLAQEVRAGNAEAPLQSILSRTLVAPGKVVGESRDESDNMALDVEQRASFVGRLVGAAVVTTSINAASAIGLTADDLVAPLAPLQLHSESIAVIRRGCERLIDQDFVSALHILVPHIEDAMRQHLRSMGVDTTDYRGDVGDGTSRTDDASLGTLMRRSLPDGRTVKEYFGADIWDHFDSTLNSQTGPNLRNNVAHGLARSSGCTPESVGTALSLLYLLADVASLAIRSRPTPSSRAPGESALALGTG